MPNKNSSAKSDTSRSFLVYLIPILIFIGIIIAVILWLKPAENNLSTSNPNTQPESLKVSNKPNSSDPNTSLAVSADNDVAHSKFTTGLENLPQSLNGTQVDGEIIIDDQQQLVVTEGLRRLFDYFLTTQGEEDIATIIQRVESYIRHHTPEPAATEAIEIFRQYLAYLDSLTKLEEDYSNFQLQITKNGELDLNLIAKRKNDLDKLRQTYFSEPTIQAFFAAEDEYDDYSISMLKIDSNNSLDPTQKEAAKQDYISRMPDNTIKKNIEQQANLQALIERTEKLKANGGSDQELYNLRREMFGAPAAARLALIDKEDENFHQRFMQYQSQKQQLTSQQTNPDDVEGEINSLEQRLFNEAERKRLKGYAQLIELEELNQKADN